MVDLKCGDCLELMKDIPDKSIDMVLADLPLQKVEGDMMELSTLNKELESLIRHIDEVGSRPDYKRGGNYNDRVEYEMLLSSFCNLCRKAFKEGRRFTDGPEE